MGKAKIKLCPELPLCGEGLGLDLSSGMNESGKVSGGFLLQGQPGFHLGLERLNSWTASQEARFALALCTRLLCGPFCGLRGWEVLSWLLGMGVSGNPLPSCTWRGRGLGQGCQHSPRDFGGAALAAFLSKSC